MDTTGSSLLRAAHYFAPGRTVEQISSLGSGLIHATFLVRLRGAEHSSFVLQRMNRQVFSNPQEVVSNLRTVTAHLAGKLPCAGGGLRFPQLIPGPDGALLFHDDEAETWRALSFIEHSHAQDSLANLSQARELGNVLGQFHQLLSDVDPAGLADTLPGFHIAPQYLAQLDAAWARWDGERDAALRNCHAFVEERRDFVSVLEQAKAAGVLPLRIIHGDPKVNNFLFDQRSGHVVSLIDLDTVKPGLIHYDLGDCLRSACNRAGEDPAQPDAVRFDVPMAQAILEGYLQAAGSLLQPAEYNFLLPAIRLIPLELGIRFLADHLSGNRYFRVQDPGHNLRRAQVQLRLVASIEAQAPALEAVIGEAAGRAPREL